MTCEDACGRDVSSDELTLGLQRSGLSYYYRQEFPPLMRKILVSYSAQVGELYAMGGELSPPRFHLRRRLLTR